MVLDRTTKQLIAVVTFVTALILLTEHAINERPLGEWWIAGVILLISIGFWAWLWQEDQENTSAMVVSEIQNEEKLPNMQEWIISKENPATLKKDATPIPAPTTPTQPPPSEMVEEVEVDLPPESKQESEPEPVESVTSASIAEPPPLAEAIEEEPAEADFEQTPARHSANVVSEQEIPDEKPSDDSETEEPIPTPVKTESSSTLKTGKPDDLSEVNGIGPKYKTVLNEAGITTFAELAQKSADEIAEIISNAGARRIANYDTWNLQAEFLATGDTDGLEKFLEAQKK